MCISKTRRTHAHTHINTNRGKAKILSKKNQMGCTTTGLLSTIGDQPSPVDFHSCCLTSSSPGLQKAIRPAHPNLLCTTLFQSLTGAASVLVEDGSTSGTSCALLDIAILSVEGGQGSQAEGQVFAEHPDLALGGVQGSLLFNAVDEIRVLGYHFHGPTR